MTRRHIEALIESFKAGLAHRTGFSTAQRIGYRQAVVDLAWTLAALNPSFNARRFISDCDPAE